jgi:hypothetical protein
MKKVHRADMVAHLWAHQSQDEARNSGGNFRFYGPVLYSYSTPIAMLHKADTVALITSDRFSVTTAKQQDAARQAARHLTVFDVPFIGHTVSSGRGRPQPKGWRTLNRDYLSKQYAAEVQRLEGSRRGPWLDENETYTGAVFTSLSRHRVTLDRYCSVFGLKAPWFDVSADAVRIAEKKHATWEKHAAFETARRAARDARWAAETARREAEERLTYAERVEKFRAGEAVHFGWGVPRAEGAMLRVKGDTVETSQGAVVPLTDAARAVAFVARVRASGVAWARNGEQFPVGQFQLDSVSETGEVRAGCHLILWDEVVRLQAALPAAGVTA